jgi:HlyD family secretion protein
MRNFFKKYRTLLIILLLVIIGTTVFLVVRNARAETTSTFETTPLKRDSLTATIGATGTVRAQQSAVLIWQAAGTVDNVNVNVGDTVRADGVLAELSKSSLPQTVILAQADLVSAQKGLDDLNNSTTALAQAAVNLRDAQDAYDKASTYYDSLFKPYSYDKLIYLRKVTPFGVKMIPEIRKVKVKKGDEETIREAKQDLDLAEAKIQDAQREYDLLQGGNADEILAAQARVEAAEATLNLSRVIAPFNGTVIYW